MIEYYKEINLYLYRLTGDKVLAKDLTQETFTKVLEASKTITNIQKAYLYQIAKNLVIDKSRKDKLALQTPYDEDEHSIEIEDILLEELRKKQLKESIKKLPPQQKKTFIMFFYKGKTRKEIALILNISINAVEKNITRAIAKIKEEVKDYE